LLNSLALNNGDWTYSAYFASVDVIHDWGRLPSEFGLCRPEDDMAVMTAFTSAVSHMRAWEHQEQEREMEKQRNAPKRKANRNG
jgi:hypothetical protein